MNEFQMATSLKNELDRPFYKNDNRNLSPPSILFIHCVSGISKMPFGYFKKSLKTHGHCSYILPIKLSCLCTKSVTFKSLDQQKVEG